MKKFLFSLVLGLFTLASFTPIFAECSYNGDIQSSLGGCKPTGSIISKDGNYNVEQGVKQKVVSITNQLIILGSVLSVGGIVFAAILYVTALGDGEKVKKAKTALKFSIVGFVVMLLSFPIVNAIVNLIYGLG